MPLLKINEYGCRSLARRPKHQYKHHFYMQNSWRISIVSSSLSANALSCCDIVAMMLGIGKGKLVKVLQKFPLTYLGSINAEEQE